MSLTLTVLGAWIAALAGSVIASPAALSPFFSIGETRNAIRPGPAHLSARISSKLAGRALSGRSVLQADDPCAEYFPVEQGTLIPKSCLPADYDINWVPPPHCPALADIPASGFIQSECFPPPPPPPDAAPEDPWINPADCPAEPWLLGDAPVSVECFPPVPPDYIPPDGCPVFIDDTILEIPGRCFPRAPEAYNSWEAGVWVEPDFCEYYDAYYYGLGPDDLIPAECVPPPPQWWVPPADCPAPSPGTLVPLRCIPPGEFVQPESQVFAPGGGFEFAPPCGGPDQPPCFECGGPGQPPCEKCGGPGEPPCECGGEGQPPCGDCGGPDQPPCDFTGKLVDRCFTTDEDQFSVSGFFFRTTKFDFVEDCVLSEFAGSFDCLRYFALAPQVEEQCEFEATACTIIKAYQMQCLGEVRAGRNPPPPLATAQTGSPSKYALLPDGCDYAEDFNGAEKKSGELFSAGDRQPEYLVLPEEFDVFGADDVTTEYGVCTSNGCNNAEAEDDRMGGKPPLTCLQTVVDLELDDVLEETHPCYSLVWDNEMTWQCAEYLNNSDKTEEIQCGHSADVCTSIRFSLPSDVDLSGVDVPESENSSITDTINSVLGEFGGASYLLHTGCGLSSMCPAEPGLAEVNYRTYDLFPEHFNEVLWFLEEFDYSYYDDEYYYDEYYDEEYYDAEYYDEEYYYDESTDDAAARKVASAGERRPTKRALKARQTKRALKTRNLRQDGEATPAPDVLVTVEAGCCTQSFCTSGVAQAALSLALAALSVAAVVLAL